MLTCHSIIIAAGCQGVFENVSSSYKIKIQFIPQAKDRPTVRNFTETLRFFFFFFFLVLLIKLSAKKPVPKICGTRQFPTISAPKKS